MANEDYKLLAIADFKLASAIDQVWFRRKRDNKDSTLTIYRHQVIEEIIRSGLLVERAQRFHRAGRIERAQMIVEDLLNHDTS